MSFPIQRPRRLRRDASMRRLVRETELQANDLVLPLFVRAGTKKGHRKEIASMPGVFQLSPDEIERECAAAREDGVSSFIFFGLPTSKDAQGSEAWADDGAVQQALRASRRALGADATLIADVCLCEYTDHGHCGVLDDRGSHVTVKNDATLPLLAKAAVSLARAGADVIAPSDMMDGRVAAIRRALDEAALEETPILSYAVKYASGFYGPFRDAAESAPKKGDRSTYQMDPANAREAVKEARLDVEEGADMIMVKPALAYLDIIRRVREDVLVPVAAYNVSGEYAMVKAASARGWIDEARVSQEILVSIKRAGADVILTYFAREAAKRLA
ncbi:porphobilinogen synthase [bacterium]|nr:porphobilinogen synthase [bacterium]